VSTNLRLEVPLLNSSLRKNYLNNIKFKAYSIGFALDYLTYPVINLGSSIKFFLKFLMGYSLVSKYFLFNKYYNIYFLNSNNYINLHIFLGTGSLIRTDSNAILNSLFKFLTDLNLPVKNLNIISRHLGRLTSCELGIIPKLNKNKKNNIKSFNFLLGLDNIKLEFKNKNNFNIFQGYFYFSNFFEYINLVLPVSIYSEKVSSYINLEGRFRFTNKAIVPFKFIFLDTNIIESFSILFKNIFPQNFSIFNNFYYIVKFFNKIFNFYLNYLVNLNNYIIFFEKNIFNINYNKLLYKNIYNNKLNNSIFSKVIYNYYSNDVFSKKSKVLSIAAKKINFKSY